MLGLDFFGGGCVVWALAIDLDAKPAGGDGRHHHDRHRRRPHDSHPDGRCAGSLPPSSFATGSGVVNMIRQTGMAIGVAILVALVGGGGAPTEQLHAFHLAWWVMAAITALGLAPTFSLSGGPLGRRNGLHDDLYAGGPLDTTGRSE